MRWLFAGFVLDESSLELSRDGQPLAIERKPLQVLLYLLQHAPDVVTKDELQAGVWPGRFLSETVLTKAIGRSREVLGDGSQGIIKTVHGVGYRLVAPVRLQVLTRLPPQALPDMPQGPQYPHLELSWMLETRIVDGKGDVWLVGHDKTREARLFKFTQDPDAMMSLKREITLFRRELKDILESLAAKYPSAAEAIKDLTLKM